MAALPVAHSLFSAPLCLRFSVSKQCDEPILAALTPYAMTMASPSAASRWLTFNAVGALGVAVQLCTLALLVRAEVPLPVATLLAVEAAVLHNFTWHERYTWKGITRPDGVLARLARFHALNGVISLVGNIAITTALAQAGLHPVLANGAAIAICSTLNFIAADRLVFMSAAVTVAIAGGPTPAALAAWDKYVATVDARYWNAKDSFFALDTRGVPNWRERAKTSVPMVEVAPSGVPDAKLHHWAGAIYIPNTTVAAVVKRMHDYGGRESEFYEEVKASKLLSREGDTLRVFMRLYRDAGPVSATYNTEHTVQYRMLPPHRASSRSVATKIAELEHAGTARERERTSGQDHGFLWKLNAYWRFEQVGDGVLIECESVSLSRAVPWALRPFVTGIVDRIARESLERTLVSLRKFLVR